MIADFAGVNRIGNTKENFNVRILGRYVTAKNWNQTVMSTMQRQEKQRKSQMIVLRQSYLAAVNS